MKHLRICLVVAAGLLAGLTAGAQELKVKSFELLPKDKTACSRATARKDAKGKKCAVIKLVDGVDAAYKSDSTSTVQVAAQPVLLYVSAKDKSVLIDGGEFGTLEYVFETPLKAAKTYQMEIERIPAPEPEIIPEPVVPEQQFVLFTVNPAQAIIELGGETLEVVGGEAQKILNVGTYQYKVSSKYYYPTEGEFTLTADEKVEVEVALREANGCLEVLDTDDAVTGADVYVDEEFAGKAPLVVPHLLNGPHKVLISKEEYNNLTATLYITDNDTLKFTPCLDPNFAVVTLTTTPNANIWANGVYKGTGSWTGKLTAGVYDLEAREVGYTSQPITREIVVKPQIDTIEIPAPTPIYGNVLIMSHPAKATVIFDGEVVGETPLYLPKVQYGEHQIRLEKEGFKPYVETVVMSESMRIEIDRTLKAHCGKCAAKKAAIEALEPVETPTEVTTEVTPEAATEVTPEATPETEVVPAEPALEPVETPATEPISEPVETPAETPAEPVETPAE